MNDKNVVLILIILIVVSVVIGLVVGPRFGPPSIPSNLGPFASCLKDKGATFYGAFWCSHCQAQKAMFGDAAKLLPYVECSTPDGQRQTANCTAKGIEAYPTWIFADGTRIDGEVPVQTLADKTGCVLPSKP